MSLDYSHLHRDMEFENEITRQILMLIMDDEDDDEEMHARGRSVVSRGSYGGGLVTSDCSYFSGWSESVAVPGWMERLWAGNGGGTGVFIPQLVATAGKSRRRRRRHNKSRKNN
ncbi:hypothetical protein R6Q59_006591 [Mikania micrantha]|uniref:Uncharacterized protein n=1 Tax=Mikania micrantha TaxID=192012 RepID=A0A5N6PTI8_9ASTR|nr:hypothetical protein E3N88_03940 [Mikania micrantha]